MYRDTHPEDFKGGGKIVELVEALGAAKRDRLEVYLKKKLQISSPKSVIRFLHSQGFVYNNLENGYVYASLREKPTTFSDVALELFLSLSESETDGMDRSKYPIDMQFYIGRKIYHLIDFQEHGLEKLKYRYTMPKALTESEDVIPIIVSVYTHQKNIISLRDNQELLPAQPYIFAKATVAGKCEIELIEHEAGEI